MPAGVTRWAASIAATVAVVGSLAMPAASAGGSATYYVNGSAAGAGSNASCADPYATTIAAAVTAAADGDTVHVCAGTYADQVIDYSASTKALTFEGAGRLLTILDGVAGASLNPIIRSGSGTLTIRDLTMQGGAPAVVAGGSVAVTRVTFSDNENLYAGGAVVDLQKRGGAINASGTGGTVSITDSTFTSNAAAQGGGAIYTRQALSITSSTLTSNESLEGGGVGGGAILGVSSITVTDSTLSSNRTGNSGGAIRGAGSSSIVTITGSLLSSNVAGQYGGGVAAAGSTAQIIATNSTFSANRDSGGNCFCTGAAVYGKTVTLTHVTAAENTHRLPGAVQNSLLGTLVATGTLTMTNSLLVEADPEFLDVNQTGPCSSGTAVDGGGNVVTSNSCSAFGTPVSVASVRLGPLADNGGTTPTYAVDKGGSAVDVAACPLSVTVDQRGWARPYASLCDAGAYEAYWTTTAGQVSPSTITIGSSISDGVTVTGLAPKVGGGTEDPQGTVTFSYCFHATTTPIWADCASGATTISTVSLLGGASSSDGVATASLASWTPPDAGRYLLHAAYTRVSGFPYRNSQDNGANHALTVQRLTTGISYTGTTLYPAGTTAVTLEATVTGGCIDGRPVFFWHDTDSDGTVDAIIGSAATDGSGLAQLSWDPIPSDLLVIEAVAQETPTCSEAVAAASIVIGTPFTPGSSSGGGSYTNGTRISFGYTAQKRGDAVIGRLVWMTGSTRALGTIDRMTALSSGDPRCGGLSGRCLLLQGTVTVRAWDGSTWAVVATGVAFQAIVLDGGSSTVCVRRTCLSTARPDHFAFELADTTVLGESISLSNPTSRLRAGGLVIR